MENSYEWTKTIVKLSLPFLVIFEGVVLQGTAKIQRCLTMRSNTASYSNKLTFNKTATCTTKR